MRKKILYPFIEDSFNEETLLLIEEIGWLQKSKKIDAIAIVDKIGQTSQALKKAKIEYKEIPFKKVIGKKDFYLTVIYKLFVSSLAYFCLFREHKFDALHCTDLMSMLCFGNIAKMNRVPFIVPLSNVEKFSHYASLILADTRKIVCKNEEIREKVPTRFSARCILNPRNISPTENLKTDCVDFWINLYDSLDKKKTLEKTTALYK